MSLYDIQKKIQERKTQWENHVPDESFEFADQHAQEDDWLLEFLDKEVKLVEFRLSELEKEVNNQPSDEIWEKSRELLVRVDELRFVLGEKKGMTVDRVMLSSDMNNPGDD